MTTAARRTSFRAFEDSTERDWARISPNADILQSRVPDHVVEQLRYLEDDNGVFPVSRLEHSLQTATRAERDGRDEEYVLCALLHDIGDALSPMNHGAVAAAVLKPFVSEANHWMVAHHEIFQGYYFWHHLGKDRNTRDAYRDSPYFDYTVEFCARYDQVSFDADYRSEPLEHFLPLIRAGLITSVAAPSSA